MLGSTVNTCTASVYIRLEIFTEFLREGGLGPLRSASACGVDTPVVAQMRLLMVFQTIEIFPIARGHGDRRPWCVGPASSTGVVVEETVELRVDELMG